MKAKKADRVGPLYALAFGRLDAVEHELLKFQRAVLAGNGHAGSNGGCGVAAPLCQADCSEELRATLQEMRVG